MIRKSLINLLLVALVVVVAACNGDASRGTDESASHETFNSIYHWKTTFAPDSAELVFLKTHNVRRIYVKMFDVAVERDAVSGEFEIVPIATTKFISPIPEGIEIVPTTYITLDALREMEGREYEFANLIVERLKAMNSYNECGKLREVQFDCDWTASTRHIYDKLCSQAKEIIAWRDENVKLSATIRLHQLGETPPPVDRGVLMLYNTGAIKNPNTRNSILDIEDVKPYLKNANYSLPLDYAFPTFGWGVKFKDGKFQAIVSRPDSTALIEGETLRIERPTAAEVLAVKKLVEEHLGQAHSSNIIYHLDNSQLANYSDHEIAQIYSCN